MKLILWGSIFWLPLFQRRPLLNEASFKKNLCIGTTFPFEAREDAEILAIIAQYKKEVNQAAWLLMLLIIPAILCPGGFNLIMGIWGFWLLLCLVLMQFPFIKANKKLRALKAARGWKKESAPVFVDTTTIEQPKWIHPSVFILLTLLPLGGILIDKNTLPLSVIMAASNLFLYFVYRYTYRNKSEMVDGNVELTQALSRIRRREWGKMFLMMSLCMALLGLLSPFMISRPALTGLLMTVFCAALCWATIRIEMNVRRLQEKLTENSGKDWYVDDDDHWIWGCFYYNPDDSHMLINNRTGAGNTVNLAHPVGKVFLFVSVLIILWVPFVGPTMDALITSEITVTRTETEITAESGKTLYTIPVAEIAEIQELDQLPDGLYKVLGTNTEKILKGDFTMDGIGSLEVCVNQDKGKYWLIRTEGNRYYLINAE